MSTLTKLLFYGMYFKTWSILLDLDKRSPTALTQVEILWVWAGGQLKFFTAMCEFSHVCKAFGHGTSGWMARYITSNSQVVIFRESSMTWTGEEEILNFGSWVFRISLNNSSKNRKQTFEPFFSHELWP